MQQIVRRPALTAAVLLSVLWVAWTAHRVANTLPVAYGYWRWNRDDEIRIIAQNSVLVVAGLLVLGILIEYARSDWARRHPH